MPLLTLLVERGLLTRPLVLRGLGFGELTFRGEVGLAFGEPALETVLVLCGDTGLALDGFRAAPVLVLRGEAGLEFGERAVAEPAVELIFFCSVLGLDLGELPEMLLVFRVDTTGLDFGEFLAAPPEALRAGLILSSSDCRS